MAGDKITDYKDDLAKLALTDEGRLQLPAQGLIDKHLLPLRARVVKESSLDRINSWIIRIIAKLEEILQPYRSLPEEQPIIANPEEYVKLLKQLEPLCRSALGRPKFWRRLF